MKALARRGDEVLWLDTLHGRNNVEMGDVLFVNSNKKSNSYNVVWLEGYKSRNDDFLDDRLLAILDLGAPVVAVGPYTGNFRLTPAGRQWVDAALVTAKLTETDEDLYAN